MSDRIPPGQTGSNYNHQILGTDENGYVRKVRVDSNGEMVVDAFRDKNGLENFNAIFGEKYVAHRKPVISANFNYATDMRKTIITQLNGATVDRETTLLTLNSGTSTDGESSIQSKESLRYQAGRDSECMFTCRFDPPVEGNTRRIGLFDEISGMNVGYEELEFGVSIRKAGVNTFIPQSEWNHDKCDGTGESGFNWDFSKLNIVRIFYGYLGIAPIFFQVYGGIENGWITFEVYDIANKSESTHIDIPYLPLRASNKNHGNTTNVKIQSGSIYCGTVDGGGGYDSSSREFSRKLSLVAVTAGTDKPMLTFHNKPTYQGVINRIDDRLLRVALSTDGTKVVNISLYKISEPTSATWTDVDTLNSNMRVSTDAVVSLVGGELLMSWTLGKTDSVNDDVHDLNLLLFPNEYAVFTYTSTGSSDLNFANRWSELF